MNYYNKYFENFDHEPAFFGADGWIENTSGNDICPSFSHDGILENHTIIVYTDYKNVELRECESLMYLVSFEDSEGTNIPAYQTNSIHDLNNFINFFIAQKPIDHNKDFELLTHNDTLSWVRCIYGAIDENITDRERDEVNTAMAWICESLNIDVKEV